MEVHGGGKSALIALDSIMCAYAYPECQNIIGRKSLVTLFETTWITLLRTLTNFGFELGKDYKYDGKYHRLEFANKSIIIAKNLEFKPSDKEGTEYGSLEILRAYVDQSEHVSMKIIDKVTERAGSHYTASHYDIKGKVFEAFNPSTSHTKKRYWLPFKTETENEGRKFVRALPSDNPGKEAKKWVADRENDFKNGIMPKIEYQKQILGNFDYDDNPNKLCGFDTINAIFENNQAIQKEKYYITADIARLGSDYARIAVWKDWEVVEFVCFAKSRTTDIKKAINALRIKYNIPRHLCIADEDGVGCLPIGMQVLTDEGWVNSEDITEDTNIISKDEYGNKEIVKPYTIIHHEEERFIKVNNDLAFTVSHSHFYKTRKDHNFKTSFWDDITEKDRVYNDNFISSPNREDIIFNFKSTSYSMPNGGIKKLNNELNIKENTMCKFLGWYLSEGCLDNYNNKYYISITQTSKSPHNDEITEILNDMGVNFNKKVTKNGSLFHYRFQHKDMYSWLLENCYNGKSNCYNKLLPSFLKNTTKENYISFCKCFINGDGYYHKGTMQFISSSERMIDDIQEGLFMVGIQSNKHIKQKKGSEGTIDGRTFKRTVDCFLLSELKTDVSTFKIKTKEVYYDKAINIKIPNKTRALLVKNGNSIFWTHNGGVVDECRIKGFVNGSKPIYESVNDSDDDDEYKKEAPQYKNLKTQCLYIFARFINLYQVYISADLNEKDQQEIIEEIEQIQSWDTDDDGKLKVKPKAKIKEDIGHSPDWSDTLMMRCWFYLVKEDDETDVAIAIVSK